MFKTFARLAVGAVAAVVLAFAPNAAVAQSGNPITIGFAMSLTGPLAANGKQALLGMKIWEEETNAKGGLLGRPVKLVTIVIRRNADLKLLARVSSSFDQSSGL